MIKTISVQNFQSHKNSVIKLSPGVNAFIGDSDHGKTAILRAINWCVNNKPSGDAFRSFWGGETKVALSVDNHIDVTRYRDDNTNDYFLAEYDGEEDTPTQYEKYTAFGQGVPEQITDALNIKDINFQSQMSSSFLLSSSSGEVARYLNSIVGLDIIDTAMYNINKIKREEERELKFQEDKLESSKKELEQYNDVDDRRRALDRLLSLEQRIVSRKEKYASLHNLVSSQRVVAEKYNEFPDLDKVGKEIAKVILLKEEIKELSEKNIDMYNDYIEIYNSNIVLEEQNWTGRAAKAIEGLEKEESALKTIKDNQNGLQCAINGMRDEQQLLKKTNNALQKLEKQFKEEMGDTCPLCGGQI